LRTIQDRVFNPAVFLNDSLLLNRVENLGKVFYCILIYLIPKLPTNIKRTGMVILPKAVDSLIKGQMAST